MLSGDHYKGEKGRKWRISGWNVPFTCCGLLKEKDASTLPGEEDRRKAVEEDEVMGYGRRQGIHIPIDQVIEFSLTVGKSRKPLSGLSRRQ